MKELDMFDVLEMKMGSDYYYKEKLFH